MKAAAVAASGLALSLLGPGSERTTCPVSAPHTVSPAFGPALGRGAVYAIGFSPTGTLAFEYPPSPTGPFAGTGWGGAKTLWVARRTYRGPIVIRGRQIGGPHEVRFALADGKLVDRLAFEAGSSIARSRGAAGWRQFPTYTRLEAPGCYAFTVKGSTFSRRIVFRAKVVRSTASAAPPRLRARSSWPRG